MCVTDFFTTTDDAGLRLLWAAEKGKRAVVMELVQKDSHLVHSADKDGYTPLHRAAYENHANIVQVFL